MKSANQMGKIHRGVPCPFCSLLCDDLIIENHAGNLKVKENGCPRAIDHYQQVQPEIKPAINGKVATLDEAILQISKILKSSHHPLFSGLGTDIGGLRSAFQLADKTGAIIDHMHSEGIIRNTLVLQDLGWMMTTLTEIKNHADLIIFAGTDAISKYPRFFERFVWNKKALFNKNTSNRKIIYIGEGLNTEPGISPDGIQPTIVECKKEEIGELTAILHATLAGDKVNLDNLSSKRLKELKLLANHITNARYGVLAWAPGELDFPHAELTIQAFCEMVKFINRTNRFNCLSLGGNDGGTSAVNVSTWQSGYPLQVSFSKGYPVYDPSRYSTENVLKNNEADAMMWISSFSTDIKPPKTKIPTIVLATPTTKLDSRPDVFIPVGTPGIDHNGYLFRTDSVVSLPLKQVRQSEYSSVKVILDRVRGLITS
jgi:formylmethanofuran dehydrogenase subunit B